MQLFLYCNNNTDKCERDMTMTGEMRERGSDKGNFSNV